MIKKFEKEFSELSSKTRRKKKIISYANIDAILHREDGPAEIRYYHSGYIITEKYWSKGKNYTKLVRNWLITNKLICEEMNEDDFNRMWMEIL